MFSYTLATSNVAGHADTYNMIIITAATSTPPGATFDIIGTLAAKPDPSIPSAIELTSVTGAGQGYASAAIVPIGTDYTIVDVFDPHDSVDIIPFTIGPFSLTPRAIPEPSSLMLLGIGILGLAAIARRRVRRSPPPNQNFIS
jgi:hypothetical protein